MTNPFNGSPWQPRTTEDMRQFIQSRQSEARDNPELVHGRPVRAAIYTRKSRIIPCQQDYDVILMDIQMPEMGGDEATQKSRETIPANKHAKLSKFLSPPQADGVLRNFAPSGRVFLRRGTLVASHGVFSLNKQPYIVAMTAHALEGDRDKYLSLGMDDYVSKHAKPLTKEKSRNRIHRTKSNTGYMTIFRQKIA